MRRKLLLLDLALLALTAAGAWRLRQEWNEEQRREDALRRQVVRPAPAPPMQPLPEAKPVQPAGYAGIAEKMLFSRDRNPVVEVQAAPPPPPKPMPRLPLFHGIMNLGDGPSAIMSEKKGAPNREFHPGERVGEFTLVAINSDQIVLEWDGKQITKRLEELIDRGAPEPPASAATARAQAAPAAAPQQPPAAKGQPAPGVDIGKGLRACQPGDASPAGTVVDGMRKVVSASPFGQVCRWEAVQ